MDRNDILLMMRMQFRNKYIRIPEDVITEMTGEGDCRIVLLMRNITEVNMQDDCNAFESWASAIYLALGKRFEIILDTDEAFEVKKEEYKHKGHFCRFLYRAMRFSEQYDWFTLSESLQREVDKFRDYLSKGVFTNNIPKGEAHENTCRECKTEARLAEPGELADQLKGQFNVGNGSVYRQLPTGLFKGAIEDRSNIFSGKKSAADMWNINGDEFRVYELKAWNKMVGIVTEIFFYSNYFKDLLVDGGLFTLNTDMNGDRGYRDLLSMKIRKVKGVLLADEYHPIVSEELISLLNQGNSDIEYVRAVYSYRVKS